MKFSAQKILHFRLWFFALSFTLYASLDAWSQTPPGIIPGIDRVEMLKAAPDQKMIAAGVAGRGKNADFAVVRLKSDLTIDRTFGRDGIVRVDAGGEEHLYGLVVLPFGKIIVAGFVKKGKQSDFALARVTSRGELDGGFGKNGVVTTDIGPRDEIHFIALTADNSIVAAGFVEEKNDIDFAVVRYRQNGLIDNTFGKDGIVRIDATRADRLYGVALQWDGKIVATGSTYNKGTGDEECVAMRLTPRGKPDKTFGHDGLAAIGMPLQQNVCSSVVVQRDGKILVAGYTEIPPSPPLTKGGRGDLHRGNIDFLIARFLPDGKMDRRFGHEGIQFIDFKNGTDAVHALAIDSHGRLVAAGDGRPVAGTGRSSAGVSSGFIALARLFSDGSLDPHFGREGKATMSYPGTGQEEATTMIILSDGKIVVGGAVEKTGLISSIHP